MVLYSFHYIFFIIRQDKPKQTQAQHQNYSYTKGDPLTLIDNLITT